MKREFWRIVNSTYQQMRFTHDCAIAEPWNGPTPKRATVHLMYRAGDSWLLKFVIEDI